MDCKHQQSTETDVICPDCGEQITKWATTMSDASPIRVIIQWGSALEGAAPCHRLGICRRRSSRSSSGCWRLVAFLTSERRLESRRSRGARKMDFSAVVPRSLFPLDEVCHEQNFVAVDGSRRTDSLHRLRK